MYTYMCRCTCIYEYIHMYIYLCVYEYLYMHIYKYMYVYIYTQIYILRIALSEVSLNGSWQRITIFAKPQLHQMIGIAWNSLLLAGDVLHSCDLFSLVCRAFPAHAAWDQPVCSKHDDFGVSFWRSLFSVLTSIALSVVACWNTSTYCSFEASAFRGEVRAFTFGYI